MQRKKRNRKAQLLFIVLVFFIFLFDDYVMAIKVSDEMPKHQVNEEKEEKNPDNGEKKEEKNPDNEEKEEAPGIADEKEQDEEEAVISGKWKSRNQNIFYYENGKKTKGLKKIGNKYYFFAANGIQRTGWQKYRNNYYFFKIANGAKGYMETAKTVNGIVLTDDGKADLTVSEKQKLDILIKANKVLEKATRLEMKKSEKLKKIFEYLLKQYQYRGSPDFEQNECWELDYAAELFEKGHGNCYAFGAGFAFLANAAGYKNCYAISSGGHGWAEVGGKIYDPTWSLIDEEHSYFGIDIELSGQDGRPNYKKSKKYVSKI